MDLFEEEHRSFIRLLNKFEVEYCLIGGYAVNLYGYTRTTGDMDVFVNPTNENKQKLLLALEAFGYDTEQLRQENFEQALYFFIGDFPFRIDILNTTVGIDFPAVASKIVKAHYEDLEFNLIHLDDLITNKETLNTYKDLDDAEKLKKIRGNQNKT